jgi:effector-binding domain-containing protein
MKTLKKIVIGIIVLIVLAVIGGFLLPSTQHIERSLSIAAPPPVVFAQINGFKDYNDWSPFVAVMPDAEYSWSGPDFGVGSTLAWTTPDGETGRQTIIAAQPYERVDIELDLGRRGLAQAAYLLQPVPAGTQLTWTFDTDFGLDLVGRFFGLFLERELGPLYAQGLANVKRIAEDLPDTDWSDIEIGLETVPSRTIAYITGSVPREPAVIADALAEAYGRVAVFVTANGLQLAGSPMAVTNYRDERGYGFDAAIPVDGSPSRGAGPESLVRMGESYGGRVVRAVHAGPYAQLPTTYAKVEAFIAAHRLERNGRSWDVFVTDPGNTPEEELETEVYYPVK